MKLEMESVAHAIESKELPSHARMREDAGAGGTTASVSSGASERTLEITNVPGLDGMRWSLSQFDASSELE